MPLCQVAFCGARQTPYTGWNVCTCQNTCLACTNVWVQSLELHETGYGWRAPEISTWEAEVEGSERQGHCRAHPEAGLRKEGGSKERGREVENI